MDSGSRNGFGGESGIRSTSITCPICGSRAILNTYIRSDPLSGRHVLKALICRSCGLRHVEDYPLTEDQKDLGEKRFVLKRR
jgi:C4-type Zn-finger protein